MNRLSRLGKAIGDRARKAAAEAEAIKAAQITTKDGRASRASWGGILVQLGQLLSSTGAHLLASAYDDAEATVDQAHDRGYEARRADEAEGAELRDLGATVAATFDEPGAGEHQDQAPAESYADMPPGATRTWAPTIEGGAGPVPGDVASDAP